MEAHHQVVVFPVVAATVLLALCWIAVCLRVYVKHFMLRRFSVDDGLIVLALFCVTAMGGLELKIMAMGFGNHNSSLAAEEIRDITELLFITEIIYVFVTVIVKLSIAKLLLSLVSSRVIYCRVITWTAIFYTSCGIAFVLVQAFQCNPVSLFWELAATPDVPRSCIPRPAFMVLIALNAVISFVTDAILAILPIFLIWNLRMDRRTKFSVQFVLALGLSTCAINIARFFYVGATGSWDDSMYKYMPIGVASNAEACIGLIAACMATLRPLVRSARKTCGDHKENTSRFNSVPPAILTQSEFAVTEETVVNVVGQDEMVSVTQIETLRRVPRWSNFWGYFIPSGSFNPDHLDDRERLPPVVTGNPSWRPDVKNPGPERQFSSSWASQTSTLVPQTATKTTATTFWRSLIPSASFNPDTYSEAEKTAAVVIGNPSWRPKVKDAETVLPISPEVEDPITTPTPASRRSLWSYLKPNGGFNPDTLSEAERAIPVVTGNPSWRPDVKAPHLPLPGPSQSRESSTATPRPALWRSLLPSTSFNPDTLSEAEMLPPIVTGNPSWRPQLSTVSTMGIPTPEDVEEWRGILASSQVIASAMASRMPSSFVGGETVCGAWNESEADEKYGLVLPKLQT